MLISVRHLLYLANELKLSKTIIGEYEKQLQKIL